LPARFLVVHFFSLSNQPSRLPPNPFGRSGAVFLLSVEIGAAFMDLRHFHSETILARRGFR
jgi:hypothetical protein